LLSFQWRGQHHTGGRAPIREQLLDQIFQLRDGGEYDLQQEGVTSGEVMTLLNCIQGGKKFQEWSVPVPVAGETHKRRDRESQRLQIDIRSISADKLKTFQPSYALCCGGGGELNSPTKLCYRETRVAAEFLQDFSVNQVGSIVLKHWLTVS
jgi:hypothetical protein